jgi:hypothetical protein
MQCISLCLILGRLVNNLEKIFIKIFFTVFSFTMGLYKKSPAYELQTNEHPHLRMKLLP